jgi:hypothetical protein
MNTRVPKKRVKQMQENMYKIARICIFVYVYLSIFCTDNVKCHQGTKIG